MEQDHTKVEDLFHLLMTTPKTIFLIISTTTMESERERDVQYDVGSGKKEDENL
jgi:hypothetical protein